MKILFLFLFVIVSCTSKDDRVVAIVNGKQIKIKNLRESVPPEKWNRSYLQNYIQEVVRKEVIQYEANRLSLSEDELFSFFETLKTRELKTEEIDLAFKNEFKDIQGKSKDEIVSFVRQKQYDKAKETYIKELLNRSTVRLYLNHLDESL